MPAPARAPGASARDLRDQRIEHLEHPAPLGVAQPAEPVSGVADRLADDLALRLRGPPASPPDPDFTPSGPA
jgi:hypothetical protein